MIVTKNFKHAYHKINAISGDVLEKFASICDRDNRFPTESFDAIKAANLQSLMVPESYGGFGLTFYEYQRCLSRLAQSCAATASAFNMHNIVIGGIADLDPSRIPEDTYRKIEPQVSLFFKKVVEEKKIFAAATTEPGIGARFAKVQMTYEKTSKGYKLNGIKSFVTMAQYADYMLVLANKKMPPGEAASLHNLSYFVVPREQPGVEIDLVWDTLGMRATGSQTVIFDQVVIPNESLFMRRQGFALMKVLREPHWVTGGYLGVYLGLMESIYNFTLNYINQRSDHTQKTGLAYQTLIQARLGDMYTLVESARLHVYDAAQRVCDDPNNQKTHRSIYAAKYIIGESITNLASMAMRNCGGMSISKQFPLERYVRDASCGRLMPGVSDMCQLFLGQSMLGLNDIKIWGE